MDFIAKRRDCDDDDEYDDDDQNYLKPFFELFLNYKSQYMNVKLDLLISYKLAE